MVAEGGAAARLDHIQAEIARLQPTAQLLAVSKKQSIDAIRALAALGQRDFAENYVQELVAKAEAAHESGLTGLRWHFIGHLQSNKINALLPHVASIHSVDSVSLAQKLARRIKDSGAARLPVFLEVNIDAEASKSGFSPAALLAAGPELTQYNDALDFRGLMAIPQSTGEGGDPVRAFAALKALELQCRPLTQGQLSMGMSEDYPQALAAGATHIRVGTALFGKR